jgi:hypothetical protein
VKGRDIESKFYKEKGYKQTEVDFPSPSNYFSIFVFIPQDNSKFATLFSVMDSNGFYDTNLYLN